MPLQPLRLYSLSKQVHSCHVVSRLDNSQDGRELVLSPANGGKRLDRKSPLSKGR